MTSVRGPGETRVLSETLVQEWSRLRAIRMAAVGATDEGAPPRGPLAVPLRPDPKGAEMFLPGDSKVVARAALAGCDASSLDSVTAGADVLCEMRVSIKEVHAEAAAVTCHHDGAREEVTSGLWCGRKRPPASILRGPPPGGAVPRGECSKVSFSLQLELGPSKSYS